MQNKKAIELSVNFLVIIIISLILLAFGTKFTYDIVRGVKKYQDAEEDRILKLLESELCKDDDLVCVPIFNKEITKKRPAFFGVKITNPGSSGDFRISLSEPSTCFIGNDLNTETICTNDLTFTNDIDAGTVGEKESRSQLVLIELDNPDYRDGAYILDLEVFKDGSPFDNKIHKLQVEVN